MLVVCVILKVTFISFVVRYQKHLFYLIIYIAIKYGVELIGIQNVFYLH